MRILGFITILFLVAILTSCERPEGIDIPDDDFLTALTRMGIDKNLDGVISSAEAEAVKSLELGPYYPGRPWREIQSVKGLEAFVNLETFICRRNKITHLTFENNRLLKKLDCSFNNLTDLDVSNNSLLTFLCCNNNQLTSLDVSNTALEDSLDCSFNQLNSLNVSNTALNELLCYENQLTSLDVTNNAALERLDCRNNQL